MRKIRTAIAIVLLAIGVAWGKPPHIVMYISDDLGRLDTSVYGHAMVRTPTLDALASQGMVFENAYVASPSCCPNRASLLTGLMPARHGAHPNHSHVKPGTKELVPLLKGLGYKIASFGKVQHGRRKFEGCDFHFKEHENMSQDLAKLFESGQLGDDPVCLFIGDRRPHVPWIKESIYDPDTVELPPHFIDTPETREHWARYLSDITHMDAEMGRSLEIVKEHLGVDFITLFTSDHGGQWPLGKWNLYDSGTRVPLIVSWPQRVEASARTEAMVSWVDLIPTLIDLAGGEAYEDIDGKSFAGVLRGETDGHRREIFTTHTGDTKFNIYPVRSVRIGNFKYIHNLLPDAYHTNHSDLLRKDGAGAYWDSWEEVAKTDPKAAAIIQAYYSRPEYELFDLDKDPLEFNNLASNPEYKAKRVALQRALSEWTEAQGDELAPHRSPYLLSEALPDLRSEILEKAKKK